MPADPATPEQYSATAQRIYAELADRLRDAEAENLFTYERSFIRRTRKGKCYWYSRRFVSAAGNREQREKVYIGPDTYGGEARQKRKDVAVIGWREIQDKSWLAG